MAQDSDFESCVRRTWRHLVEVALPRAAVGRGWPVATPRGFVRVLLDHVHGGPWERQSPDPSADQPSEAPGTVELILAISAGERLLSGEADLSEMNRRSLAARAAPLDDAEIAALLVEAGAEADALAAAAGLSAADLVSRICDEAAARRRR